MAVQQLFPILLAELSAFQNAVDKREHLIQRCEYCFDQLVEPMDLPGPDRVVDPGLRSTIRPLVGRLFDEAVRKLESQSHAA